VCLVNGCIATGGHLLIKQQADKQADNQADKKTS
jgi:hypothetical protein